MGKAERVKLLIPPARSGDADVIIGWQGKLYQIPRGITVEVPLHVKEEYERSVRASQRRYENEKKLQSGANT